MSPVDRRTLLRAAAGAGAVAAVGGGVAGIADLATAGRSTARTGTGLRIGYLPITDASPLLVAHAQGRFAAAGLEAQRPVLFRGWESLAQAFLADEVDVVHLLMPFAVQLRYALGARIRMIAWGHTNGSALTVAPRVGELAELAGQQVAIPFWWSIHNVMLQRMLRGAGLRPVVREQPSARDGTVGLVVLSPADMLPALDTGRVAGYIVADPFNAAAEIRKVGRIARFVGDSWRRHACCVVVVRQGLVDTDPAAVQGITDAVTGAQRWIDGARAEAASVLSTGRYLPQPLPAITRALDQPARSPLRPDWHGERIGFEPFPFPGYTQKLVETMRETVVDGDTSFLDGLDPAAVHADLTDDRFVRRSIDAHGGPAAFGLPASLTRTEDVTAV
ncbi:ABC transporter substrate-binding protein (plasmid) [Pseudonocardia sp. EC080610-09]|uniref:ABC transporter substrate-binding protein n=1 Tax=unclassified Pseudonocardia TaxID=2619320 RepID=UPI000706420D|nr:MULTISPECIES: ABC transporter substrate-binding protein [unclassified Pseudonocardia]ALL79451.1 ABC transporter substrate-binding protein [Pseudonocardia sp. EC080610-09]ALL85596.1 ABC transporter substrate-binding protein [Pseudonocardia sp. EC080619-01]